MYKRATVSQLGNSIVEGIANISVQTVTREVPTQTTCAPSLGSHEVRIKVKAAAVNFPDLLMTTGEYQFLPSLPYTPGSEAAGIVADVGKCVTAVKLNDKVICTAKQGMMSGMVVVSESSCLHLPKLFTFQEGAAFWVAASTAYHCLVERVALKNTDTILINGASGGVGLAAVQVARAVGCTNIIATGSSMKKLNVAAARGATTVIDLSQPRAIENLPDTVKERTEGEGVHVVYDPVGGKVFENSLRATRWGARVAIVGFASGIRPSIRSNYVLIKGLTIFGCRAGEFLRRGPDQRQPRIHQLLQWADQGKLTPHVSHTYPIDDVQHAFTAVCNRDVVGKAVVVFDYQAQSSL